MISATLALFSWLVGVACGALLVCVVWARSLTRKGVGHRDVPPPVRVKDTESREWDRRLPNDEGFA